ncbi:hypothetical protein FB451DRAFT_681221 [Mycena latifolia]|nr:hypothetical protein FB451DRAFT_681221 [Mycena latifolia]
MISNQELLPIFPLELEREIFETTADLYPATIPNLLLVSQRACEWIERIKYRTVTSTGAGLFCPFRVVQQAIRSNSKPAGFFHDRVRNLFIETTFIGEDELQEILSVCSGIRSLVLYAFSGPSTLRSLGAIKPQRLSLFLTGLFQDLRSVDPSHPVFTFVTHFDLFDSLVNTPDFQSVWANLILFPALTHLSLLRFGGSTIGRDLLAANMKLEVLVHMQGSGEYPHDALPSIDDPRFVAMVLSDDEYESDWLAGTKGGLDFWARAELFIAKKRRGEIQPSSRCWIEPGDGI